MPKIPPIDERDRNIPGIEGMESSPDIESPEEDSTENSSIQENDDGSVDFTLDEPTQDASDFLANLAEVFDTITIKKLGIELVELVEKDKQARSKRDEQYEEGLRRTGLGNDAPGGAEFSGASRVVHPMLAESCIDFASRAIKELFPPSGPVKTCLEGAEDESRVELAKRKSKYLNWQMTKQMREYRAELEQLLTQLPMGGSQYQKFWWDDRFGRIRVEFVPIDDVILPFAARDFYTAQRQTHVQHLTGLEYGQRVKSGLYLDLSSLKSAPNLPEPTASEEANRKIEGKEEDVYNEDGLRDVLEIYLWASFDQDEISAGQTAPYIVTVDVFTQEVLAIYRNWEENDEHLEKLDWLVEWKFIPWRGIYAIGFPHLIGGLSGASTGALRALLDSAHINNSSTLVKLRGGRVSGQNIEVEPTQIAEIEGPAGVDDIRKVLMAMPYNQPSPVLFQLLGWLTDAGKGVIATAEEQLQNVGDRTPVGTTMAMIEQGSQTYSAIHARLHYSQSKALSIICRLNSKYMDDEEQVEELGDLIIRREEFNTSDDIVPVTDPNIFSEAQRFAQMQGLLQLRAMYNGQTLPAIPGWNDVAIARRMLTRMRIEGIDELLPEPPKPQNMNPAAENIAAMRGAPITALPKQNHLAHIFAHVDFCTNPVFANPIMGKMLMGGMLSHISEHIGLYYAELMSEATNFDAAVPTMPTKRLESTITQANSQVLSKLQSDLTPVSAKIQQIAQMAQQFTPPPPMDPAVDATYKAAMAEIERKKQRDSMELDLERQHRLEIMPGLEKAKLSTEIAKNREDNRQKYATETMKNQGDNQTAQWIAALNAGNAQEMSIFQSKLDAQEADNNRNHELTLASLSNTANEEGGGNTPAVDLETEKIDSLNNQVDQLKRVMQQLISVHTAPRQVVRDSTGKVIGIHTVNQGTSNGNVSIQ